MKNNRQIIFEDDLILISVTTGLKEEMTIISFSGFGNKKNISPSEEFNNPRYTRGNQLFIVDKQRSWGNNFDFESISAHLTPFLSKNVMTIGNSMGGFLAILATQYIHIDVCITFNPQYSVHPNIIPAGSKYPEWVNKIKTWRYLSLKNSFNPRTLYYVFTSDSEMEKKHYLNFPRDKNIRLYIFKKMGHKVVDRLKQKGLLLSIIRLCSKKQELTFK